MLCQGRIASQLVGFCRYPSSHADRLPIWLLIGNHVLHFKFTIHLPLQMYGQRGIFLSMQWSVKLAGWNVSKQCFNYEDQILTPLWPHVFCTRCKIRLGSKYFLSYQSSLIQICLYKKFSITVLIINGCGLSPEFTQKRQSRHWTVGFVTGS